MSYSKSLSSQLNAPPFPGSRRKEILKTLFAVLGALHFFAS